MSKLLEDREMVPLFCRSVTFCRIIISIKWETEICQSRFQTTRLKMPVDFYSCTEISWWYNPEYEYHSCHQFRNEEIRCEEVNLMKITAKASLLGQNRLPIVVSMGIQEGICSVLFWHSYKWLIFWLINQRDDV